MHHVTMCNAWWILRIMLIDPQGQLVADHWTQWLDPWSLQMACLRDSLAMSRHVESRTAWNQDVTVFLVCLWYKENRKVTSLQRCAMMNELNHDHGGIADGHQLATCDTSKVLISQLCDCVLAPLHNWRVLKNRCRERGKRRYMYGNADKFHIETAQARNYASFLMEEQCWSHEERNRGFTLWTNKLSTKR